MLNLMAQPVLYHKIIPNPIPNYTCRFYLQVLVISQVKHQLVSVMPSKLIVTYTQLSGHNAWQNVLAADLVGFEPYKLTHCH